MKPLETYYRGYKFRSRLEARWAVFFDVLGVKYRYEAEGFKLPSGAFLPDFLLYLPGKAKVWAEIKPPNMPEEKLNRLERVVNDLYKETGIKVLCIFGEPWPGEYNVAMVPDCLSHGGLKDQKYVFALGRKHEAELWLVDWDVGGVCLNPLVDDKGKYPLDNHPKLLKAYEKARSSRFEYGEHPIV